MIDSSEKPNRQLGFELQSSHVIENRNKINISISFNLKIILYMAKIKKNSKYHDWACLIMIDGSEKPNCQLGFELQSSHVIENGNKINISISFNLKIILYMAKIKKNSKYHEWACLIFNPKYLKPSQGEKYADSCVHDKLLGSVTNKFTCSWSHLWPSHNSICRGLPC